MRLVFRADASVIHGSGHVMRISAIAEEAMSRGVDCVFVGSITGIDWLEDRIARLGFSVIADAKTYIVNSHTDTLVLDSYSIPIEDPFIQPVNWKKIVSIVDPATPAYRSNLEIHTGFDGSWNQRNNTRFLFGPEYIPLRKSISKRHLQLGRQIRKVLVFGGGTDPFGFAEAVSQFLVTLPGDFRFTIFSQNSLAQLSLDHRFTVINFGEGLDAELECADLVFTTASTSSLEIIARGIPVGIARAVENQSNLYRDLGIMEVATPIGVLDSNSQWNFDETALIKLIEDSEYRDFQLSKGINLIDLYGSKRIIDEVLRLARSRPRSV